MRKMTKYLKTFYMGINDAMQYRLNFILGLISIMFPIIIQIYIWNAVYIEKTENIIYGFSYKQMILYTLLSAVVSKFIASDGFEGEVNEDIKNGGMSKYLIKPISYSKYRISCSLGKKAPQSLITFIILVIIILISNVISGTPRTSCIRFLAFIFSLLNATLLNLMIIFCTSAAAFWISDAGSFFLISSLVVNVFSGGVFPLEIFGDELNMVFSFLPYKYTIYYPVTIINGKIEEAHIAFVLVMQIFWILALVGLSKLLWYWGMRKYNAIGG